MQVGVVDDDFLEFFYKGMKPWVHYVPVHPDMHDAEDKIKFFKEHDGLARAIAQRGYDFINKNLDMPDITEYWRQLLMGVSNVTKYTVKKHPDTVEVTKDRHVVVDKH